MYFYVYAYWNGSANPTLFDVAESIEQAMDYLAEVQALGHKASIMASITPPAY